MDDGLNPFDGDDFTLKDWLVLGGTFAVVVVAVALFIA